MPVVRILLVEDDEVLRDLLRRNLVARGHQVFCAGDGETALVYLHAMPIDLVVLDINLPDQTGWEILRTAQREGWLRPVTLPDGTQKLPVVVLSAVRVSLSRLAEFHPLAYLPKPFPMEAVLRLAAEAGGRKSGASVTEQEEVEAFQNAASREEELHA